MYSVEPDRIFTTIKPENYIMGKYLPDQTIIDLPLNSLHALSHEVCNSLANISAYVQLLQLENVLDKVKADRICAEVSRINKMVNDFSRLAKPLSPKLVRMSIKELLNDTVVIMFPKATVSKVEIKTFIDENVYVRADKTLLQQVIINIIDNAIQAMESGGTLSIRLSKDSSSMVLIEFTDTGPGISPEDIGRIFKFFYTTKKTGSGLGLAICENLIKLHNGSISVKSSLGSGTTFTILLPCAE
jgi:signal transduction histidine kinase